MWTRLGLRARVTVTFALGALLLSGAMGYLSYVTTRHFLVAERESASLHLAFESASFVRTKVPYTDDLTSVLSSATAGTAGAYSLLELRSSVHSPSRWSVGNLSVGPKWLPRGLRARVDSGPPWVAATQTYVYKSRTEIAVGVPIPAIHGVYYEIFDISDLSHILRVLALALFGAGLVTTVLGAALGRWASGRSLRPLASVSKAAVAVAGGQLDTRLAEATGDPDLAGLTRSFNRMVDQLQERIEREARFTSDVSHELRSPLTTLAASLEVLESQADDLTPSGKRALELLAADLRRFQRMVGDLLEISRSDTGSADLSLEEVDPGELVRRAVAAARRSLPAVAAEPPVTVAPGVAGTRMTVDKRRFERVIANLLENAALYGGGATAVRVEPGPPAAGHPCSVWVSVEDAGPGLAPSERSRVFERFYRGHAAFRRGAGTGTGLGLALVAEHVRLHGGRVWVDEAAAGGARFTIELPAELADEPDERDERDERDATGPTVVPGPAVPGPAVERAP